MRAKPGASIPSRPTSKRRRSSCSANSSRVPTRRPAWTGGSTRPTTPTPGCAPPSASAGPSPRSPKRAFPASPKAPNAKAQLAAVRAEARHDAGYIFSRVQSLRRGDKIAEAGALMLTATPDPNQLQDLDEWWVERRLLARKLLDIGDARTAYAVVRDALPPTKDNYRAEHQFTAVWIALRFLDDPAVAAQHFSRVAVGNSNPITI